MKILFVTVVLVLLSSGFAFAGLLAEPPLAAPTLAPWGMIGSAAALGISGLYFIVRRRK
jgi:hypothetical protein